MTGKNLADLWEQLQVETMEIPDGTVAVVTHGDGKYYPTEFVQHEPTWEARKAFLQAHVLRALSAAAAARQTVSRIVVTHRGTLEEANTFSVTTL